MLNRNKYFSPAPTPGLNIATFGEMVLSHMLWGHGSKDQQQPSIGENKSIRRIIKSKPNGRCLKKKKKP